MRGAAFGGCPLVTEIGESALNTKQATAMRRRQSEPFRIEAHLGVLIRFGMAGLLFPVSLGRFSQ
jgi:hypothetical protein